jgi:rare lipoprotein A
MGTEVFVDPRFAVQSTFSPRAPRRDRHRRRLRGVWIAPLLAVLVAGCATRGGPSPSSSANRSLLPPGNSQRDGPEAHPPSDLDKVPDAQPRIETIRPGGPNKPYEVDGRTYVPITDDRPVVERGLASWYGKKFQGHRTSSGEAYNMYAMTAAHPTLPIPSYAKVRNPANGHEIIVRVNDRGPFSPGRIIDLSYTAALRLGVLGGVAPVEVERITDEAIRTGAYLKGSTPMVAKSDAAPAPAPAPRAGTPGGPPTTGELLLVGQAATPPALAVITTTTVTTRVPAADPGSGAGGVDGLRPESPVVLPPPANPAVPSAYPSDAGGRAAAVAAAPSTASSTSSAAPSTASAAMGRSPVAPTSIALAAPASVRTPAEEQAHAFTPAAAGYWVQLGAYRQRDGALGFQKLVSEQEPWLAPLLAVYSDKGLHRLQAGPYPTREEAHDAAERIRTSLQLVPSIVEKR